MGTLPLGKSRVIEPWALCGVYVPVYCVLINY